MKRPKQLLNKFRNNECSPEEFETLIGLFNKGEDEACLKDAIGIELNKDSDAAEDTETIVKEVYQRIHHVLNKSPQKRPFKLWYKIAAAAVIVVICSIGLIYFNYYSNVAQGENLIKQDVGPGGNKAILTLADGTTINLSDATNGILAQQTGITITKTADGKLAYTPLNTSEVKNIAHNTITTPRGGQYQINLPDGTKVWLNAATTLKFPAAFTGLKNRIVELSGEAYFEVAHDTKQSFIVKTNKQEVEVLGTHFNINSYADESTTKTTLLQGAVIVRKQTFTDKPEKGKNFVVLKPGEQSSVNENISVKETETETVTAWKDGNFLFNDTDFEGVLKQLSRWYDVKVDYDKLPKNHLFTGFVSRSVNLSRVLEMLEVTGNIKFKIEDKTIKIMELTHKPM